ncbi:hypothetical protein KAFR_0J00260 [Kazachstania africana CBS 2517]|uniref:J domain-containing protein n=1 Tax=Kazachstania africana (strain ATCC 22294 / BCRC 22015 / CBS 2517 / CECT 1963 / NBRC 1671 / NRRL Y-8276) TaxID=1071382 RepID=H2B0E4_KAZAF|nr:hypothetical protein KAFR_0J00260 [Kazachstania africana CBS 2517]CCF60094.1 hypothetical protein KAFR_0J00260 [Kazachstania africana CBS 2517]
MLTTDIRSSFLICVVCLMTVVFAFSAQEVEIFKLQNEIAKRYGETIDFYKLLKITNKATSREITKNLRKLSKKYHPDKNPKYRKLYERLNLATQILADDTRRKTYDYYLKNGFPDYDFSKGGFFFNRVQPKTWIILSFVYVAISVIHYIILRLQYKSDVRRIQFFINQCKDQDDTSGLGEKRLSFKQHEEDEAKELIVRFGDVYIIEEDGKTETLISPDTISTPTIFDSAFFRLPGWFYNKTIGKFFDRSLQKDGKKLGTKKDN